MIFFNVQTIGDKLQKFLIGWDSVLTGQAAPISVTQLQPQLL